MSAPVEPDTYGHRCHMCKAAGATINAPALVDGAWVRVHVCAGRFVNTMFEGEAEWDDPGCLRRLNKANREARPRRPRRPRMVVTGEWGMAVQLGRIGGPR